MNKGELRKRLDELYDHIQEFREEVQEEAGAREGKRAQWWEEALEAVEAIGDAADSARLAVNEEGA